jgi:hypothetical protein
VKSVSFDKYQRIWLGWRRGNSGQRWGQYLFNCLCEKEEEAPGLFYAETVREANLIFNEHFLLEDV